jgi:hypothetical protein
MRRDDPDDFPADQGELLLWDMEQAFFPPDDTRAGDPAWEDLIRDALCIVFRLTLAENARPAAAAPAAPDDETRLCHAPSILYGGGVR